MKNPLLVFILMAFGITATATGADQSEQARVWLDRMAKAMEKTSYQGTFIYSHDGRVDVMRITHVNAAEGIRERLYTVSGPKLELIRDKGEVRCLYPDNKSMLVDAQAGHPLISMVPAEQLATVGMAYDLSLGKAGREAGRPVQEILVQPKDNFRYGYSLWLDTETGLPLKSLLHDTDEHNTVLAKLQFTDVRLNEQVDVAELNSQVPAQQFIEITSPIPSTRQVALSATPRWRPAKVPPGFRLLGHRHGQNDGGQPGIEHMIYSDGLATISVYVEPLKREQQFHAGPSKIGAMNAYGRISGSMQITAVGEVPPVTVKSIVDTLHQVEAEQAGRQASQPR